MLTFYVFAVCLLAGVFLTADVLSEEKRAGTLGLLFLTDLKGYDIVLGKFMAQWLNSFYGLLALMPALALPLLLGGVTGGEFWRMVLALVNVLFFSLTAGVLISALGWEARRTMGTTFWLLALSSIALPALALAGARVSPSPLWSQLNWVSPFSPFVNASETRYGRTPQMFWASILVMSCLSSLFLVLASIVMPRVWQQGRQKPASLFPQAVPLVQGRGTMATKDKSRAALLKRNPVLWLASDQLGIQWGAWIIVGLWGLVVLCVSLLQPGGSRVPFLGSYAAMPFGFCLKLLFALQAGRLFADHRRSGAMELLLSTPLTSREIIRGQMLALIRNFLWPFVTFLALLFAPIAVQLMSAIITANWQQFALAVSGSFLSALYAVRFVVDLIALCYFGNALALTLRRPQSAPMLTLLFGLILPSMLAPCQLDMIVAIVYIVWGARKTGRDLRLLLNHQYQPVYFNQPSPTVAVT
jgi:ABC-type transport system involved in multi-copper enzyme maturation permease subunit